jgi:phosphoglycerate dehydrogenase-like enzyme
MTRRILVTARSFGQSSAALDLLTRHDCDATLLTPSHPLTSDELRGALPGFEGVILGLDTCDAAALAGADQLRVISRYGAGMDKVDVQAAAARGILIASTPGANALSVTELTIGFLFALARQLPQVVAAARQSRWLRPRGLELTGKTLALIGFGAVGREVGRKAAALDMRVIFHDPFAADVSFAERVPLDALWSQADFVSLHCALTPETADLINARTLSQMRPGAFLINTARGGLVDELALCDALASAKLAGAALDVLRDDPPVNHPLLALENCLYTPHIGATTDGAVERTAVRAARNLIALLDGQPCADQIRPSDVRPA